MAIFSRMQELRRILRLHANWLVYAALGESALTASELAELTEYGKLPMGSAVDLVDKSYLLGRMRSTTKTSEYKNASEIKSSNLTSVELVALEAVKTRAAVRIRKIADDAVSTIVLDPTLLDNQKAMSAKKKGWSTAVRTEFHTAKVQGIANTIASKADLYAGTAGSESDVSVVPAKQCCEDCRSNYLGVDGNPKVFKLSELMRAGSNADVGVSHSRVGDAHPYWKTTLPPLHPNCGCMLVYVPPGHGWVSGKLTLLNKSLFSSHVEILMKTVDGVRGNPTESTVKPTGAPSAAKAPKPASVPGAAAPGNVAGPGRPPGSGTGTTKGGSGGGGFDACPYGGGDDCKANGGDGAMRHKRGGGIMQAHQQAMANGKTPKTEYGQDLQEQMMDHQSKQFNKTPHPRDVVKDHLSAGKIGHAEPLGDLLGEEAGVSEAYKVDIVGNGSGCMKPPMEFPNSVYDGKRPSDGGPSMPRDSAHKSEAGAYTFAAAMGMEDHIPVTVVRNHDGRNGVPFNGDMSVQHWQDDYHNYTKINNNINSYADLIDAVPEQHREKVKQKLQEIAVLDIAMNNNDRHMGNLVFKSDMSDVKGIDQSLTFASGMAGHKNMLHNHMTTSEQQLKVPDHMVERFKNQSLEQTRRATEGMEPWQQVQTHVRMKYLAHLQESQGNVPIEVTRYAAVHAANENVTKESLIEERGSMYGVPRRAGWPADADERDAAVNAAHENWEMPDQLYARFAKAYVNGEFGGDETELAALKALRPAYPTGSGYMLKKDGFKPGSKEAAAHDKFWDDIPAWSGGHSSWSTYSKPEATAPTRTAPEMPDFAGEKTNPAKNKAKMESKPSTFESAKTQEPMGTEHTIRKSVTLVLSSPHMKFPLDI